MRPRIPAENAIRLRTRPAEAGERPRIGPGSHRTRRACDTQASGRRELRHQHGQDGPVRSASTGPEKDVAKRTAQPVGDPALRQTVVAVVDHVAALAQRDKIFPGSHAGPQAMQRALPRGLLLSPRPTARPHGRGAAASRQRTRPGHGGDHAVEHCPSRPRTGRAPPGGDLVSDTLLVHLAPLGWQHADGFRPLRTTSPMAPISAAA